MSQILLPVGYRMYVLQECIFCSSDGDGTPLVRLGDRGLSKTAFYCCKLCADGWREIRDPKIADVV